MDNVVKLQMMFLIWKHLTLNAPYFIQQWLAVFICETTSTYSKRFRTIDHDSKTQSCTLRSMGINSRRWLSAYYVLEYWGARRTRFKSSCTSTLVQWNSKDGTMIECLVSPSKALCRYHYCKSQNPRHNSKWKTW